MACTKNPIIEYINYILNAHEQNPNVSIAEIVQNNGVIDLGHVSDGEICCPDCGSVAYLGPVYDPGANQNLTVLINTFLNIEPIEGCCDNYEINNTGNDIVKQGNKYNPRICCNSFGECGPVFNNLMQENLFSDPMGIYYGIYRAGVQEYNTFNNDSTLCLLNSVISSLSVFDKTDLLKAIFENGGLFSFCDSENDVIQAGTVKGAATYYSSPLA